MSKSAEGKEYLTVQEAAQLTRRSATWVYRHCAPDSPDPLPCIRMGRGLLFDPEELQEFIDSHRVKASGKLPAGDGNARDGRIRTMSRKRYQAGTLRKRGKSPETQYWEASWREYVRGEAKPRRRSARLGLVREISPREAKRECSKLLGDLNSPDYQPESPISLDEFWQKYKELVLPNRKHSTRRDMTNTYNLYVKPELGSRQMKNIARETLQMFFNRLSKKGLAYNTRKKVKIYLSSIFTNAVKYGYLKKNEVRSVDLGQKPPDTQPHLPTAEELKMIQDALPEGVYRMLFETARGVGGRAGEITALRWKAIDLERGVVSIRETIYDGKLGL